MDGDYDTLNPAILDVDVMAAIDSSELPALLLG